jgi:hypothetical protein
MKWDLIFLSAITVVGGFSILSSAGDISRIRAINREKATLSELDKIAQERFKKGCLLLSSGKYPNFSFPLVEEGKRVGVKNQSLPNGTIVCDVQGGTASIRDGRMNNLASTTNRSLVGKTIKKFRGGSYSQPQLQ